MQVVDEVLVAVGTVELEVVEIFVVDVSSLHPNHPGVLQVAVDVVVVVVLVLVALPSVVVVSSRQPHHPGVWHVVVRVRVLVDVDDSEAVVLLLLPVTSFQSGQSKHSGVNLHSGALVHFFIMLSIT